MLALMGKAEEHGAFVCFNTSIVSGRITPDGVVLQTLDRSTNTQYEVSTPRFINAAGLSAATVARSLDGFNPQFVPPLRYAKGSYFAAMGRTPFSRLIYPVPEPGGLGVHLTLDLMGGMRFGPDVEWVDTIDYQVNPQRAEHFYAEIRKYWPQLADNSLQPAYSGIRPKLARPGDPNADFVIQGPQAHGVKDVVNLFGIESPGLTSCLAIAEHTVRLAIEHS